MAALIAILMLLFASPLWAQSTQKIVVNSQGSSGVPIACAGACTPLLGDSGRKSWSICNESTTNVRCEVGSVANAANATSPSSTVGFLIAAQTCYSENLNPGNRIDCNGTASLDTWEEY